MMNHRQLLILTIFTIHYINCSPYSLDTVMKRNRHLCGPRLKDALSLVCNNIFAPGKTKKADDLFSDDTFNFDEYDELDEMYSDDKEYKFPFLRKDNMIALPRKRKPGIVEECCHKPCTEEHLRLYCWKTY
ncbi:unnamed protein product [Phaedon cochleariae]|uniref:Insulin-like domain-containing protein n=1 Tax=Phaedon cochleariae TaxID=80249 RepID=A0A9P0DTN1_PHACE|nr:unnamed protein product [Phaedon cochleariae]